MSKVTVAAVQMTYGLENAMEKVREAASQGAQIILLPELFENWYFCQERSYENYHLATTLEENPMVMVELDRPPYAQQPHEDQQDPNQDGGYGHQHLRQQSFHTHSCLLP